MLLVAGSYTAETEPGIYLYRVDQETAECDLQKVVIGIENPSYITLSADKKNLFAVSESKEGNDGRLSVYTLNQDTIAFSGDLYLEAAGSCFVTVDSMYRHAFVANYRGGTLTVIKLNNRLPTEVVQVIEFAGNGPNAERQEASHIHTVQLAPDERFLYCTDLGSDRLHQFTYYPDEENPVIPCDPPYINLPPGSGPRHLAFDKNERNLYLVTELSGEIFSFSTGNLKPWLHRYKTIDEIGDKEAADIQVHPNGKFLYASLRGQFNEIAVYKIDGRNGSLKFIQRVSVHGMSPRSIVISTDGDLLFSANEQSNNITIFRISAAGKLYYTSNELKLNKPTCVKLIEQ